MFGNITNAPTIKKMSNRVNMTPPKISFVFGSTHTPALKFRTALQISALGNVV